MKITQLLVLICSITIASHAQITTKWIRDIDYGEPGFDSITISVNLKEDIQGNYIVLLDGDYFTANKEGIHLLKLNKYGFVVWKKSFLTNHDIIHNTTLLPYKKQIMDVDSIGNIYVLAHGKQNTDTAHLVKIDPAGNLLLHRVDFVPGGVVDYIWGLRVCFDNSIIIARRNTGSNFTVIKYDDLFNLLWSTDIPIGTSSIQDLTNITWDNNQVLHIANGTRLVQMDYANGNIISNNTTIPFPVGLGTFWMNDGDNFFQTWKPGTSSPFGSYTFDTQLNQLAYRTSPVSQMIMHRNVDGTLIENYFNGIDSSRFNKIDVGGNLVQTISIPQTSLSTLPAWIATNGFFDKTNKDFYGIWLHGSKKQLEIAHLDSNLNFLGVINKPVIYQNGGTQINHIVSNDYARTLVSINKFFNPYKYCFTLYNFCNTCIDNLQGKAFIDANSNCVYDSSEVAITNLMIDVANVGLGLPTDTMGNFSYELPAGNYQLTPVLPGTLTSTCATFPLNVNLTDTTVTEQHFPLQIDSTYHDFSVSSVALTPAVPGNAYQFLVNLKNHQFFTDSASVSVTIDTLFTVDSISILPSALTNQTYVFNNLTLQGQQDSSIIFYMTVDTLAQLFDTVYFQSYAAGLNGDNNSLNDTSHFTDFILSSFDPNDKLVYPSGNITVNDSVLRYTIRFQNTGTYMAKNVVILDTLDNNLDFSSLEFLSASHNFTIKFIDNNVLEITFTNINLPDSNSSEPFSHGFFIYTIKQKSGLALGTQIENSAAIYFDYNAPVITSSVFNTIVNTVSVSEVWTEDFKLKVFPNPVSGEEFFVEFVSPKSQLISISLTDITGRLIDKSMQQRCSAGTNNFIIKKPAVSGVYFIAVTMSNATVNKKIVVLDIR